MKRILLLVILLAVLASMATVFLFTQSPRTSTNLNVQDNSPESMQNNTAQGEPVELREDSAPLTEVWVITTTFNTVFVQNAAINREAYEKSYAKIVSHYIPVPSGIRIFDSQQSTADANTFFVTTETAEGTEAAYILNTKQKTFKELFSSVDYFDFKYAGIRSVSPQENAILFQFASCRGCDGGVIGGAIYNISNNSYKNIGLTPAFRWVSGSIFEYKLSPSDCEAYFSNPFNREDTESLCNQKLEAASWIRESL